MDLREINTVGAQTRERLVGRQACPELATWGLLLCGLSAARPGFRFHRPAPRMRQLLACRDGAGEVLLDGAWRPCTAGRAYLTPARRPHAYRATGPWELAWVIYEADPPAGCAPDTEAPQLIDGDPEALARVIDGLHREVTGCNEAAARGAWVQLLQCETRRLVDSAPHDDRLDRLWAAVSADPTRSWTVAAMAHHCGVGGEHLRRLCRHRYGTSPARRLRNLRLERAAALLATSTMAVTSVARLVGYDNAFAFSTAFRRRYGMAPSAWRWTPVGDGV